MASNTERRQTLDAPFDVAAKAAEKLVREGHTIYQKFTCAGCGNRLTIDKPNEFFSQGTCDNCDAVTDIRKQGCGYLCHFVLGIKA